MKYLLILLALFAFITVPANQQQVKISRGFFSAKDYLSMSDTERRAYATGAINGMLVSPFFGAPDDNLTWLKSCTGSMSDEQLAAILGDYIRNQPNQLDSSLNVVTFTAIREHCRPTR
ncbi:MAG TPA: hypothetical protein VFR12_07340 [Pyrinomonadaceae bacterium]|nr:hypothetical protein [Pyrinomonadaceae bacterium]